MERNGRDKSPEGTNPSEENGKYSEDLERAVLVRQL
jgi:hypothetical protein